eukprot:TRINITY_DN8332_c0_g1_i3.p1 TRINITY_DN8332_c0_g1~~TRINITY_DN8332_c0_g1_i3.p1  ORF type:complete len:697 (+),score=134.64 TRINITY_DN8332_c0_g1_i3:56-2146(+)
MDSFHHCCMTSPDSLSVPSEAGSQLAPPVVAQHVLSASVAARPSPALHEWLSRRLRSEREELEVCHRSMLAELASFAKMIDSTFRSSEFDTNGSCCVPPSSATYPSSVPPLDLDFNARLETVLDKVMLGDSEFEETAHVYVPEVTVQIQGAQAENAAPLNGEMETLQTPTCDQVKLQENLRDVSRRADIVEVETLQTPTCDQVQLQENQATADVETANDAPLQGPSSKEERRRSRTSRSSRKRGSIRDQFSPFGHRAKDDEDDDLESVDDFVGGVNAYVRIGLNPTTWAKSTIFDTAFCAVIVLNTIMMGVEIQYKGIHAGYVIGFPRYLLSGEETWPGAREVFDASDTFFGSLFSLELFLKAISFRMKLFLNPWNYLDIVIVLSFIYEQILGDLPVDPMPLRLARLARLLRLLRLVRTIQGFDALYVITTALRGSLSILMWSFALLFILQLMFAFFLNQMVMNVVLDETTPGAVSDKLFAYFGTTTRAMLSMFELTLANWPPIARMLQDDVSEWYVVFSVMHKLSIGFAVTGIINGVFMQETFKVAASDDIIMMRQAERKRTLHMKKMLRLFKHADSSGDGNLGRSEFRGVMTNPGVKSWLAAQELNVAEPDLLFELLKNSDDEITAEGLVAGVARLAGSARSFDLVALKEEHKRSDEALREMLQMTRTTFRKANTFEVSSESCWSPMELDPVSP